MGCCASAPADNPARFDQGNSSSRAINSQQPPASLGLQRPSTVASTHSSRPQQPQPLSTHVNQPIVRHTFTSKRLWTRADLDRERVEFFDTRVTGRAEMWQAIRAALELMRAEGGADEVATAQQILDSAGLTVPTGSLHRGIYDSLGALYSVPEHIISDPSNLLDTPSAMDGAAADVATRHSGDSSSEIDEEELLRRREEKGKGIVNPKDMMPVKVRLSDTGSDLKVSVGKNDSVRLICQIILDDAGRSPPTRIKIAYLGKILDEKLPLKVQGWKDDHVLNALVFV